MIDVFLHSYFQFNIHSYPTTMLFNESRQTEYTGHHNSRGILQFVKVWFQHCTTAIDFVAASNAVPVCHDIFQ